MRSWCDRCGLDLRPGEGLPCELCWDGVADPSTVRSWIAAANTEREAKLVAQSVRALRSPAVVGVLRELTGHPVGELRAAALLSLTRLAPADAVEILAGALASDHRKVRLEARAGLGEIGGPLAIEALLGDAAAQTGTEWVEAIGALAMAGAAEALADVRALAPDHLGDWRAQRLRTAAWMLVRLGDAGDRAALRENVLELHRRALSPNPDPGAESRASRATGEAYEALKPEHPAEAEALADAVVALYGTQRVTPASRVLLKPLEPRTVPKQILTTRSATAPPGCGPVGPAKFGGQPDWVGEPAWPLGGNGRPMIFYGQLPLPGEPERIAYIFLSGDSDAPTAIPLSDGNALVLQPGPPCQRPTLPSREGPQRFSGSPPAPQVQPVELEPGADPTTWTWPKHPPGTHTARAHGDWNKIGGTPLFLQSEQYPPGDAWRFAFQFTGSWAGWDPADGAEFYGYVNDKGEGALLWQCH